MRIGVIGAGRIGGGAARQLAQAGHELLLSYSRDPKRLDLLAEELGDRVTVGEVRDAAVYGDVVLLSVPWRLVPDVLETAGALDGKVVIDTTNHFASGGLQTLPPGRTAARVNADRMPGARVVKAFNTLTAGFQRTEAGRARRTGRPVPLRRRPAGQGDRRRANRGRRLCPVRPGRTR